MLQRLDLGIPGGQQVPQPRVRMAKLLNQLRSGYLGHNPRSSPSTPEDQASPLRQRAARIHPQPRRSHPTREWTPVEALSMPARRQFAELLLLGLRSWGDHVFSVTVRRPGRPLPQQDPHIWPTPFASYLRHMPWLPVEDSESDGFV